MVLDDEDTLSETPRDTDTWNSPDPSSPYSAVFPNIFKREHLQRPNVLLLYAGFAGPWNWERKVLRRLSKHLEMTRSLLRRELNQSEVDAMVEHTSREVTMRGLGLHAGLTSGGIHAYFTLRRMLGIPKEMPFFQNFRNFWQATSALDRRAAAFQAGLRVSFWVLFMMGNFQAYSTYRFSKALSTDSRMEAFRDALKRYAEARMQRLENLREKQRRKLDERDSLRHPSTASAEEPPEVNYGRGEETPTFETVSGKGEEQPLPLHYGSEKVDPLPIKDSKGLNEQFARGGEQDAWKRIREQRASSSSSSSSSQQSTDNTNFPGDWRRRAYQQQSENTGDYYETEERTRQQEREAAQRDFDRMLDAERQLSQDGNNAGDEGSDKKGWRRW